MRGRAAFLFLLLQLTAPAVIIDRIAVIIDNKQIIKQSDIERDIRVTSFLNDQKSDFSLTEEKKAVGRLIDQAFIRREITAGEYPTATFQQADGELAQLKKDRFRTEAAFNQALHEYRLSDLDLRAEFRWQLTVLQFIDTRFRPAVVISEDQIEQYYREHTEALEQKYPGKSSLEDFREMVQKTLTDQEVNKLFFGWLDEQRKDAKIQFLERRLE